VDKSVIRAFWRSRAKTGRTRWTDDEFLRFELEKLRPLVDETARILDLGSGYGELSRGLCPTDGSLLAIDREGEYGRGFEGDSRFSFVEADVTGFASSQRFDVVLLFGVVTHLDESAEESIYRRAAAATAPSGICVVKNQCADDSPFEVDGWSADLQHRYVGRYPSVAEQRDRLGKVFSAVDVELYPQRFKVHENSSHVMFTCRRPRAEVGFADPEAIER
jgi:SAM-dependent methyltransferase